METTIVSVTEKVNNITDNTNNNFLSSILLLLLILYANNVAPKLSQNIIDMMNISVVKIFIFFLILYNSGRTFNVSLMSSLILFFLLEIISNNKYTNWLKPHVDTGIPNEISIDRITGVADKKFDKYDPDVFMHQNAVMGSAITSIGLETNWKIDNNQKEDNKIISGMVEEI